jgi:hypothetical protein
VAGGVRATFSQEAVQEFQILASSLSDGMRKTEIKTSRATRLSLCAPPDTPTPAES